MVAGSHRDLLSYSDSVRRLGPPPPRMRWSSAERLSGRTGGWFHCDLPAGSGTHMLWGHVGEVQDSKVHTVVSSAGKRTGLLCEYIHSQSRPRCLTYFLWSCFD